MSTSPLITLSRLLADADAAGHDHAATEKDSGLQHIHNHATGAIVWFPTWQKFRRTSDWADAVTEQENRLDAATAEGTPLQDVAAALLADRLESLLERAAESPTPTLLCRTTSRCT